MSSRGCRGRSNERTRVQQHSMTLPCWPSLGNSQRLLAKVISLIPAASEPLAFFEARFNFSIWAFAANAHPGRKLLLRKQIWLSVRTPAQPLDVRGQEE